MLLLCSLMVGALAGEAADELSSDAVMQALIDENEASMAAWKGAEDGPYFLGFRVVESTTSDLTAIAGGIDALPRERRTRSLDVDARIGSYQLDSSHRLRDDYSGGGRTYQRNELPLDDDLGVLRHTIWSSTEKAVQEAQKKLTRIRANQAVKVAEGRVSADFSREPAVVHQGATATLRADLEPWNPIFTRLSTILADEPQIITHAVSLHAEATTEWIVTSEGTQIRQPRHRLRLSVTGSVTADDGMDLYLYRWRDVVSGDQLPTETELEDWVQGLRTDLLALREAPQGDPWSGPVLLRGRAAGVFVHEVIGHRVEGHRQEDEQEGQTFRELVGKSVTSPHISIIDDPTLATYAGHDLNGHYAFDQQGVAAQKAVVVENGVLRGFLLGRDPIEGFDRSNGHGRAQIGLAPVARMANTIVTTTQPRTEAQLRRQLLAEVKKRGAPYGLVVDELAGGFTLTGRYFPNSFNIRAVTAWRVYADGRPDELVRGVDLVGTPLQALRGIVAAGDDPDVFNGYCGAESGSVPNAAVSPSLLLRSLETQRKETDLDRPPLLPKPGVPRGES